MTDLANTIASHPQEARNRIAKAKRMVRFLDSHIPGDYTSDMLMLMDDAAWLRINVLMGEKLRPSKALIMTVITLVAGREMAVEAIKGALD